MECHLCFLIRRQLCFMWAFNVSRVLSSLSQMHDILKGQFNRILLIKHAIDIIQTNGKLQINRYRNLRRGMGVNECTQSTLTAFCLPFLRLQISDHESDAPGGHCSLQLLAKCSSAHYIPKGAISTRAQTNALWLTRQVSTNVTEVLRTSFANKNRMGNSV